MHHVQQTEEIEFLDHHPTPRKTCHHQRKDERQQVVAGTTLDRGGGGRSDNLCGCRAAAVGIAHTTILIERTKRVPDIEGPGLQGKPVRGQSNGKSQYILNKLHYAFPPQRFRHRGSRGSTPPGVARSNCTCCRDNKLCTREKVYNPCPQTRRQWCILLCDRSTLGRRSLMQRVPADRFIV